MVTWYGAHSAAHAGGTSVIGVVVVTDAQGRVAIDVADGDVRGDGVDEWTGVDPHAVVTHPDTATATIPSLHTTAPG